MTVKADRRWSSGADAPPNSSLRQQVAGPPRLVSNVWSWLSGAKVVGVSAGASTPDDLVSQVIEHLCRDGADLQEHAVVEERVAFRLPPGLAV